MIAVTYGKGSSKKREAGENHDGNRELGAPTKSTRVAGKGLWGKMRELSCTLPHDKSDTAVLIRTIYMIRTLMTAGGACVDLEHGWKCTEEHENIPETAGYPYINHEPA